MNFYVRKLGHQECGDSENVGPNQRGRYIFIGKKMLDFFPKFDPHSSIRSRSIGIIDSDSRSVNLCQFNWHKGEPFNQSRHLGSDHRLYLNKESFPSNDYFRRGDYAVFFKYRFQKNEVENNFYKIFRFTNSHKEFKLLEDLTFANHYVRQGRRTFHGLFQDLDFIKISDIKINKFKIAKQTTKKYKNPDSTCNSKEEFRELVRAQYNYTCAILGDEFTSNIYKDDTQDVKYTNLDAAHFWPDSEGGPLRPDNGMLMCKQAHQAFDSGHFTIDENYKIKVDKRMLDKRNWLSKIDQKKLNLDDLEFKPNQKYLEIHRKCIFGNLRPFKTSDFSNIEQV